MASNPIQIKVKYSQDNWYPANNSVHFTRNALFSITATGSRTITLKLISFSRPSRRSNLAQPSASFIHLALPSFIPSSVAPKEVHINLIRIGERKIQKKYNIAYCQQPKCARCLKSWSRTCLARKAVSAKSTQHVIAFKCRSQVLRCCCWLVQFWFANAFGAKPIPWSGVKFTAVALKAIVKTYKTKWTN